MCNILSNRIQIHRLYDPIFWRVKRRTSLKPGFVSHKRWSDWKVIIPKHHHPNKTLIQKFRCEIWGFLQSLQSSSVANLFSNICCCRLRGATLCPRFYCARYVGTQGHYCEFHPKILRLATIWSSASFSLFCSGFITFRRPLIMSRFLHLNEWLMGRLVDGYQDIARALPEKW